VQIERGASNTLVVMARVTLSPSYWLLHFTDIERGGNAYCVVEPGNSGGAFISLTFTETTAPVALDGEVLLAPPGNWNVKIYEQTSSTNLVPASANRLVKDVDIFVVGDGVADGGWTETCPTDGDECDPLSLRVNGEPYASITDPCGAIATVNVKQDGTAVGSLVGGVWVIPTCDDLSYSLVNSNNEELDGGSVPDPCGENLTLNAPDGTITFDGLAVGTVPSGGTENLDCGTTINSAHVTLGSSQENGIYYISGTAGGKTRYQKNATHAFEYSGTRWVLIRPGSDHQAALGNETYPWLANWTGTSIAVDQGTISQYCGGNIEPCADLTVAINGTTYGTVADPCGATAAVNVHDTNGNDVGSLVSGSWVVAPPSNVLREFTTGGTWSKPTDASFQGVWVFAAGGGGSGGAGIATTGTTYAGGSAGGGGSLVRRWVPAVSLLTTETYAIGAGATGPATGAGSAGGATLFGAHVEAKGGSGGVVGLAGATGRVGGAGGSALLNVPIASGNSISGGAGGDGQRSIAGSTGGTGLFNTAAPGGGGGSGGNAGTGPFNGGAGGGAYQAGSLTAGGAGGVANGGSGTAGASNIYIDPFLGIVTSTIGIGTGGGGGAGNTGASAVAGSGAAGGRAAGGGGGGSQGNGASGTPGAGGAGGNGFLLVYEVFAI
jgi:hypothetical protein